MQKYSYLGAFESTKIHGSGKDILETTRHDRLWRYDLDLLSAAGIEELRYPVPWHRIEAEPGHFDWSWFDGPMRALYQKRMRPILDPLHHTSFPDWLNDGFANRDFPELYARFLGEVRRRYPWANIYTLFNEPLPTTLFCSHMGLWYPYQRSDEAFVRMAINVARAICLGAEAVLAVGPAKLVHIDTAECHIAQDTASVEQAAFCNQRRFLMHDLVLGKVTKSYPLYTYLVANGLSEDDLCWLQDHAAAIDVLGLDYYPHSELHWYWDREARRSNPGRPAGHARGFASIAHDYLTRFRRPLLLSETNIRGTITDRLTWLKLMTEQCEELAQTCDFKGFCWFPSIDSTDWCNLCTRCMSSVDPQGIWWLDSSRWDRHSSELSDCYSALARGEIGSSDLPAYPLSAEAERLLQQYQSSLNKWPVWADRHGAAA